MRHENNLGPSLIIPQLPLYRHHDAPGIDPPRADQTAFSAQHTLVKLLVSAGILAPAHEGMNFSEVELCQVAGRACGRAASACYTRLQLGHGGYYLPGDHHVVPVEVDSPRAADGISPVYTFTDRHNYVVLRYSTARKAAAVPSFMLSPTFFGAVTVPA